MSTCSIPFEIDTIADLLVWPTGCYYYFWLLILGALFLILAWAMFKTEEDRKGEGEMLSSFGVAAIAVTSIALGGTYIKNSTGIPMIQSDIFLWILAPAIVIILIWLYNK